MAVTVGFAYQFQPGLADRLWSRALLFQVPPEWVAAVPGVDRLAPPSLAAARAVGVVADRIQP